MKKAEQFGFVSSVMELDCSHISKDTAKGNCILQNLHFVSSSFLSLSKL